MTREEKKKAIDALKISAPVMVVTQEKFNDYIQTLNKVMNWLEQEPCEDEYIKVPKKALKYRTAGMVAYNAEWLKNHFDIERAVIYGAQEPCEDAVSRKFLLRDLLLKAQGEKDVSIKWLEEYINSLPPVTPQEPSWIPVSERLPEDSGEYLVSVIDEEDANYKQVGVAWFSHKKDYAISESEWRELGIDETVIAWMPKPEQYKAESGG